MINGLVVERGRGLPCGNRKQVKNVDMLQSRGLV